MLLPMPMLMFSMLRRTMNSSQMDPKLDGAHLHKSEEKVMMITGTDLKPHGPTMEEVLDGLLETRKTLLSQECSQTLMPLPTTTLML